MREDKPYSGTFVTIVPDECTFVTTVVMYLRFDRLEALKPIPHIEANIICYSRGCDTCKPQMSIKMRRRNQAARCMKIHIPGEREELESMDLFL